MRTSPDLLQYAADEHRQRKRYLRTFVILAVCVAAGLGGLLYALREVARSQQPDKVVIDPSRLPPIRPGPH
jgi:hypothetical protein